MGAREKGKLGPTAFEAVGSGPPVVLVHGVGLDRTIWQAQTAVLGLQFRAIAYDMLGHGESVHPAGERRLGDFVRQLSTFLDDLSIDSAAVVGFSMGALVARAFALAEPGRVSRLALLNTVYRRSPTELAAIQARFREARSHGPGCLVAPAMERWLNPAFQAGQPATVERVRQRLEANDPSAFLAAYRVFADADEEMSVFLREKGLDPDATVASPLLVMTAEDDPGSTPAMARRLAADHPGAECVILPGLRHLALVEAPEAVLRPLVRFLSGNRIVSENEEQRA